MLTRDIIIGAIAQTTVTFSSSEWTTLDLATVGPNMTVNKPGEDVQSILVENKISSASSVALVYKDDPGSEVSYNIGWEIEAGGVLQEGQIKNLRYLSFRGLTGGGQVKVMIRSYRDDSRSKWLE